MMLRGTTVGAALVGADPTWELRWTTLAMVGAILLGAVVIALVSRWRRQATSTLTASDQLAEFRSLYLEGAISKEEFERLRSLLGGELRRELDVPKPSNTAVTPAPDELRDAQPNPPREEKPQPPADGLQTG